MIKQHRERAGLSRDSLAEVLGTTTRTIQRLENEGVIGSLLLKRVCEVLRLPLVAVLAQDADSVRQNLRAHGFAPGLPPALVGREDELAQLQRRLTGPSARTVIVLAGPVGVGKTSLAQRVAQDSAAHFEDGVVWVRGDFQDVRLVQLDIARALGFDSKLPQLGRAPSGRDWTQVFATHFWEGRRLLVLDDVVDESHIAAFIADDERATILATTRFKHIADEVGAVEVGVGPLAEPTILELVRADLDRDPLDRDPAGLRKLLAMIDGMPGLARVANSALRRERLSTPASWLARLDCGRSTTARDRACRGAIDYYESLERQVSPTAWELFAGLGVFGSEPVPLKLAAAAADKTIEVALSGASELLDAQLVSLYHAPDRDEPEPWLRLALHPAAAARSLLGERHDDARRRVADHLTSRIWAARRSSSAELVGFCRRHHALIVQTRQALTQDLRSTPDLTAPYDAATTTRPELRPDDARRVLDLVTALAPMLISEASEDSRRWIELCLAAAHSLETPAARGFAALLAAWWRAFNLGFEAGSDYYHASLAGFRAAELPLGAAALRTMLAPFCALTGDAGHAPDADALVAETLAELEAAPSSGAPRAFLLNAAARITHTFSTAPDAAEAAAELCERAAVELERTIPREPYLVALNRFERETYRAVAGRGDQRELARAVDALCALQPEPWVRAGVLAHAAHFGVGSGLGSPAAALSEARRALRECTRECTADDASRLLLFVTSCAFHELIRRQSPGGEHPAIRRGLAAHGIRAPQGNTLVPEMCGFDSLLVLSVDAISALLDAEYLELALALARHVADGRVLMPALGALQSLLGPSAKQ